MSVLNLIKNTGSLALKGAIFTAKAGYAGGKYAYAEAKKFKAENQKEIDGLKKEASELLEANRKDINLGIAKGCLVGASALNKLSTSLALLGQERVNKVSDKSDKIKEESL